MKIIDTNILNKFAKKEIYMDVSEILYVTEDLKNEMESLKSISSEYRKEISRLNFIDIEVDEAKYLENYKKFINKHNNLVSFYGLKGLGDISILACIETKINLINPTLFDQSLNIEVCTHDVNLRKALTEEFNDRIIISNSLHDKGQS